MKLSSRGRDLTRVLRSITRKWGVAAKVLFFEGRALMFAGAEIAANPPDLAFCLRERELTVSAQKVKTVSMQERTIATTITVYTHKADFQEGHARP